MNICPYCIAAAAIFLCLLGLSFLFVYVPKLDSGSQNSAVLFSSYSGIMAVNSAIALMSFSALASAMGHRYVILEYCGAQAILLFSYPISLKRILMAKIVLLMTFTSTAAIGTTLCSFTAFAMAASAFSFVEEQLVLAHFVTALRNSIVIACLACGITLCSIRIGFAQKSNSMTVISAILFSMLLTNFVAAIDDYFAELLLFTVILLLTGILLMWNLANSMDSMELSTVKRRCGISYASH